MVAGAAATCRRYLSGVVLCLGAALFALVWASPAFGACAVGDGAVVWTRDAADVGAVTVTVYSGYTAGSPWDSASYSESTSTVMPVEAFAQVLPVSAGSVLVEQVGVSRALYALVVPGPSVVSLAGSPSVSVVGTVPVSVEATSAAPVAVSSVGAWSSRDLDVLLGFAAAGIGLYFGLWGVGQWRLQR